MSFENSNPERKDNTATGTKVTLTDVLCDPSVIKHPVRVGTPRHSKGHSQQVDELLKFLQPRNAEGTAKEMVLDVGSFICRQTMLQQI